jgi:RimJ/RimL family protein N-acetyltransferase
VTVDDRPATFARPAARRIRRGGRAITRAVEVVLDDGCRVTVRPLGPADAPDLAAFVDEADADDLRRRFMGLPPPTGFLVSRLCSADGHHHLVLGAFTDAGRLVAVAQFDRSDDAPAAEFAIEVASGWQRRHLGTRLLLALGGMAREHGVTTFTATYFADNIGIRRLMRETGCLVRSDVSAGEGHAVLDLAGGQIF